MTNDKPKRKRSATRPIPEDLRAPIYLAAWDLAWSGHFYRQRPLGCDAFLTRFGSGSIIARRHGLTILWLTAMAGRFNELARLMVHEVDGQFVTLSRSKRGANHAIRIEQKLIACTRAWHNRLAANLRDPRAAAMHASQYLLPSNRGGRMNVDVFNRDVAGPLGDLFGCKLSSHCFRDTACQDAMQLVKRSASLDVRAVQMLMGHESIHTTEIYLRKVESEQLCLSLYSGSSE